MSYVESKDAPRKSRDEESVGDTWEIALQIANDESTAFGSEFDKTTTATNLPHQNSAYAQTRSKIEECASSTGQRSNYAATKDGQTLSSKEECGLDTVRIGRRRIAASMDALTNPNEAGCASGMEPITIPLTNPLHLLHHKDQYTTI